MIVEQKQISARKIVRQLRDADSSQLRRIHSLPFSHVRDLWLPAAFLKRNHRAQCSPGVSGKMNQQIEELAPTKRPTTADEDTPPSAEDEGRGTIALVAMFVTVVVLVALVAGLVGRNWWKRRRREGRDDVEKRDVTPPDDNGMMAPVDAATAEAILVAVAESPNAPLAAEPLNQLPT